MYVCICQGITEKQIINAIKQGEDSIEAISNTLGAGLCCGRCVESIGSLVNEHAKPTVYHAA
ncbi:MAG: (2Fe-2S)-binding protein [Cardiobacteriaceae bacterium]|nr:(2Fe-2S)-binding protein [Cardiobacteriaceae bacterium]